MTLKSQFSKSVKIICNCNTKVEITLSAEKLLRLTNLKSPLAIFHNFRILQCFIKLTSITCNGVYRKKKMGNASSHQLFQFMRLFI